MAASIKGVSPRVATLTAEPNLGTWPTNGSITPVAPGGAGDPAEGDLILLPVYVRNAGQTITPVTGYTRLTTEAFTSGNNTAELWAKVAGPIETPPTVTDSQVTTQPTAAIWIIVQDWSGSLDDLVAEVAGSTGSTVTCPDATAPEDDCLVVRFGCQQDDNGGEGSPTPPPYVPWVAPPDHDLDFYEATQSGSDAAIAVADAVADTGPVGVAGFGTTGNDAGIGITVVIPPSGDVPPATGVVEVGLGLDVSLAGARPSAGALETNLGLDVELSGSRPSEGGVQANLILDVELSGSRGSVGQFGPALNLDVQLSGSRPALGAAGFNLELDVRLAGTNGQAGRPVQPYPFTPGAVTPYPSEPTDIPSFPWTPRPVRSFQEVGEP